jgi:hypothetical protein
VYTSTETLPNPKPEVHIYIMQMPKYLFVYSSIPHNENTFYREHILFICVQLYTSSRTCVYVYTPLDTYVYVCVCMYTHLWTPMCMYVCVCIHTSGHLCVCMCVYVYTLQDTYVYVCTRAHTQYTNLDEPAQFCGRV